MWNSAAESALPCYRGSPSWIRYRRLLAEQFDLHVASEPVEVGITVRGHCLHVDHWPARDAAPRPADALITQAKGTVLLVHGAGGHGRILAPLGEFVATLGWQALAPDLPGYGLTRAAPHFRWDYAEWPAVVAELASQCDGPVVLLGMSVGGLTAVYAAQQAPNVSGVIATTLLDMNDRDSFLRAARWRWFARLSLVGFRLMPTAVDRISLPLCWVAPMRAMSSDARLGDYFASDALLGKRHVPARMYRTMHMHRTDAIHMRCPLLLVHPGADSWTPTALSRSTFERMHGDKRFRELSNGSHMPAEVPARDELQETIADFLAAISSVHGGKTTTCSPP